MSSTRDGGEALLDAFGLLGVDYVFSSPGSEWAPVWEAVARRARDDEDAPQYLDLWHETVAVGMATGFGLMARRPSAVLLHAGAGLLQGASAIHGAQLAGVPMVICSSESTTFGDGDGPDPGSQWYRNLSIVGGPHTLVAPYVKWANQVGSAATLSGMVVRAGELAQRSPTGPVYLNVPLEVLLEEAPERPARPAPRPGRRVSSPDEVSAVAQLLVDAERPVVLTESAGQDPDAYDALVELCELLAIPVAEPQSAVASNFPRASPLYQGAQVERILEKADVVLLVGCRAPWYPPSARPADAVVVVVDDVPQRPHIVYQVLGADRYLEGDIAPTLAALTAAIRALEVDSTRVGERRALATEAHDLRQTKLEQAEAQAAENADRIEPLLLVTSLRDAMPDDALLVDETITHSRLLRGHLPGGKGSYIYVQGGLGQGLSVALGAKLAAKDRMVVLTVGDGSLLYNPLLAALAASRDYDLPILIVVFNNHQYLSMKLNHLRFYPDGAAVETGDFRGVDLQSQPELSGFAAPYGMYGEHVIDPSQLAGALERAREAVAAGTAAIVNVTLTK